MVEVTGSSPVLPTTPEKPRTPSAGFFVGLQSQACLTARGPKETKRTPVCRFLNHEEETMFIPFQA